MRKDFLDIFINSTKVTQELENYAIDAITATLTTSDFVYVGFYKPINAIMIDLEQRNTNASNIRVDYWNGQAWIELNTVERTKGLTEANGHIKWARNIEDQAVNTVETIEQYWYRISVDADTSEIIINGINLVFSSDSDVKEFENNYVNDARRYPKGRSTLGIYHQAARRHIIQDLRNEGKVIYNDDDRQELIDINIFDLLDYEELRLASTYLVCSKWLSNMSDDPEDTYSTKAKEYYELYSKAYNVFILRLDKNNDGKADDNEKNNIIVGKIRRR